jgi:hypothetical protein
MPTSACNLLFNGKDDIHGHDQSAALAQFHSADQKIETTSMAKRCL